MTAQPQAAGLLEVIGGLPADPHRPRLVCHLADGSRTELSGASLANWTAKVAGLLRDELGLGAGDTAVVLPTAGWQVAPALLGCWWAGLCVRGMDDGSAAVAFVGQGGDADADEVFVLSGHPLGAPATGIAGHQRDFTTAVLPQSDRLGAAACSGDGWSAARDGDQAVTAAELMRLAAETVARMSTAGAHRPVLISTAPWAVPNGVAGTLLASLAAGGVLVQCPAGMAGDELAAIARAERATVAAGVDVPELPRVG